MRRHLVHLIFHWSQLLESSSLLLWRILKKILFIKAWDHPIASNRFFCSRGNQNKIIDYRFLTSHKDILPHSQIIDCRSTAEKRRKNLKISCLESLCLVITCALFLDFSASNHGFKLGLDMSPWPVSPQREVIQGLSAFHSHFSWNSWGPEQECQVKSATFMQWV